MLNSSTQIPNSKSNQGYFGLGKCRDYGIETKKEFHPDVVPKVLQWEISQATAQLLTSLIIKLTKPCRGLLYYTFIKIYHVGLQK